jgi:ligand-binding sensor domain-containing protein
MISQDERCTKIHENNADVLVFASNRRTLCLFLTTSLLVLLCSFPSFAQVSRLQFQHVTTEQGLSHPSVMEICQDSSGFMWFATSLGLNRFDGREIKWINISTSANALCTDQNGDIWFAHAEVHRVSFPRDTIKAYELIGPRAIVCDGDSVVWIGTDQGLFRIISKDHRMTRIGKEALADSGVNAMAMDKHGNLWLVTRSSILRFDKASLRSSIISPRNVRTHSGIAVAPDGSVWIANGPSGEVCRIDPATSKLTDILENGAPVMGSTLAVDPSGLVYVGTSRYGLKLYNPMTKSWTTYRHSASDPQSLADDEVRCIAFDRSGNLWVGTAGGVSWSARSRKSFTRIPVQAANELVAPATVRNIVEDGDGNLWLGTIGGLRRWDRKSGTVSAFEALSEQITSLEIIHKHELWIGMLGKRNLVRLDTRSKDRNNVPVPMSLPGIKTRITAMLNEGDSVIWLGCTRCRLHRHDLRTGRTVTYTYQTPEQLFPGRVSFLGDDCPRMIYRDRQGVVWIATGQGILSLDERSGIMKRHAPSIKGNYWFRPNTWCIYEDTKGRFWVGNDLGLDLYDRSAGAFHAIFQSPRRWQGKTVVGMLEDRTGALWLHTDGNLLKYNHDTDELKHYGPNDGFPITTLASFATWGNLARCVTNAGEFVLGARNSIVLFRPEDLIENPKRPIVAITGLEVFGRPSPAVGQSIRTFVLPKQPFILDAGHNAIEFRFAGLDYTMPSQITYAVWLEPSDQSWSYLGTQNSVRFMNLPPGSYRLRVKAANGDSAWSVHEATYRFEVLPPWWMTWWFRVIAVLVSIGIVVLIVQVRMRHKLAQERLRLQIASDLHDDIGSSLSSIALVSENVRNVLSEDHPAHLSLLSVTNVARQAADRLKDDVWVIKPGSDTLENLLLRMKDATQSLIGHLQFSFNADTNGTMRLVPLEFRRNILFIYKEVLHNIVKHSRASTVAIAVGLEDGSFTLEVRDNGKGFDTHETPKGNGLVNLRRRAEAVKGNLNIESTKNGGTRIVVTARIP